MAVVFIAFVASCRTNFIKIQKAMINSGPNILKNIHKKWRLRLILEMCVYGIGLAILVYGFTTNILISVISFAGAMLLLSLLWKPWAYSLQHVCNYLDAKQSGLEYSTSLLLQEENQLTLLARLQREKIGKQLVETSSHLVPERSLKYSLITMVMMMLAGWLISYFGLTDIFNTAKESIPEQGIIFRAADSTGNTSKAPLITKQSVTVRYPSYTKQASKNTLDMDLVELQGSSITWHLEFDKKVQSVTLQHMGQNDTLELTKDGYRFSSKLQTSGFYNFKFTDTLGRPYFSELYSLESVQDQSPTIEMSGISQFTSFNVDQNKELYFEALVQDDYGIASAAIIATVSKGSGESVKFREEKLNFDNTVLDGSKKVKLSKKINLDSMQMEPGDELYFYVKVSDVKQPIPNISRGETFFASIRDTVTDVFQVDGAMGVDQMPDYFRSQRQLIIDTEKLIKERPGMSKKEFNSTSNALAFDQKTLRFKYGAFMGDESTLEISSDEESDSHDEEEEGNILSGYTHEHDTENEANLVDESDREDGAGETKEDPIHPYTHNHDDPEAATLFSKSLKTRLRMVLNEMWDAELHLRLYHPEESLPVQYRILKSLQDIKNSARIYVHRIGFDPPPIKEEKRLTGDLKDVLSYKKTEDVEKHALYPNIRSSARRLEELIRKPSQLSENDKVLFEGAGNEITELAIAHPGYYLTTLQGLKKLSQGFELSQQEMIRVQKGLISALPVAADIPEKKRGAVGALNTLFIQELEAYD
jgi:hypothetical protein